MHIAIICHQYGSTGYMAATQEALIEKIANEFVALYVKELPEDWQRVEVFEALGFGMWQEAVNLFFEYHEDETLHLATT